MRHRRQPFGGNGKAGVTLDTGALIALERRDHWITKRLEEWHEASVKITVLAAALAEWWRGAGAQGILSMVDVEPTTLGRGRGRGLGRGLGRGRSGHRP